MHFAPLDYPWKFILDSLFTSAMVYVGVRYERWRWHRLGAAIRDRAKGAWKDWTDEDLKQELHSIAKFSRESAPLEQYRTAKETLIDIGGYTVILHPGDAFTVERIGDTKPLGQRDESVYNTQVSYEALTGQGAPSLNYTIAIRCLTCKRQAPLEVHPIDGVTAYALIQPKGWRLDFESVTLRPHAAFSLRCAECRKDPLHESEH
jgi:hypothetical protein